MSNNNLKIRKSVQPGTKAGSSGIKDDFSTLLIKKLQNKKGFYFEEPNTTNFKKTQQVAKIYSIICSIFHNLING